MRRNLDDPDFTAGRINVRLEHQDFEALELIRNFIRKSLPWHPWQGSDGECVRYALRIAVSQLSRHLRKKDKRSRRSLQREHKSLPVPRE
jgi:hypothetical protein